MFPLSLVLSIKLQSKPCSLPICKVIYLVTTQTNPNLFLQSSAGPLKKSSDHIRSKLPFFFMQSNVQIVYDFNSHSPLEQHYYFSTTMQLTFKFLLLAIALAYGGTTISALPVGDSSLEARSADYQDFNAREVDDIAFLARSDEYEDFNAREVDDIAILARDPLNSPGSTLQSYKSVLSVSSFSTIRFSSCLTRCSFGPPKPRSPLQYYYNPRPTRPMSQRRQFRKTATKAEINRAAYDPYHPFHSSAVLMKQENFLRKNPKLYNKALKNPYHPLNEAAWNVNIRQYRHNRTMQVALNDKTHVFHKQAKAIMKKQQDDTIRKTHPSEVNDILSDPNHPLYKAARRVTQAQARKNYKPKYKGLNDLPFYYG